MKVVALVSGGKDSCYAMMKCVQYGHEIVALANLLPADDSVDELDSYMYQTVGHQIIVSYAECMAVPLFRRRIQGSTRHQKLTYNVTPGDEVEDMFILLKEVKRQIPCVTAVSSGAIASDYQRLRVENVCSRLGLVSLAYLWKQDQSLLLQEMIENEILAITVKVAAMGLDPAKHLGKEIASLESYLHKLNKSFGINVCGEGGEYETLTLDCPLFVNARIKLDDFEVIRHSSDAIAPVGILHPVAFHLENKAEASSLHGNENNITVNKEKMGLLFEVYGDCLQRREDTTRSVSEDTDAAGLLDLEEHVLQISQTRNNNTFSICCWLQDSHKPSSGLQEDLKAVLKKIESELVGHGLSLEKVLYIHLYIADMNEFATANETYVNFITQEKCPFGVPSRSCIELPLLQVGLGSAYIEVLVANDETKRVLHVQSISSWAPSCIGPYSQATLHRNILYMAGQLGLDPPTMTLCNGGPTAELEQALENGEAVAKCFNSSISTATIFFVVYCSSYITSSERHKVQDTLHATLEKMRLFHSSRSGISKVLDPIFLFVLSPNLPKRALVEVKPILYVENTDAEDEIMPELPLQSPGYWGLEHAQWHDSCIHKCIIHGKICAILLCVTSEVAGKICSYFLGSDQITEGHLQRISRFCIYLLDKVIMENGFNWIDITSLRFYFPTSLNVAMDVLSLIFTKTFNELVQLKSQTLKPGKDPIFNLVPVSGSGSTATSMDNVITCELFAQKS